METYEGVKFKCYSKGETFEVPKSLHNLHRWVAIFADLGLAPIHLKGAYGNHSIRHNGDAFLITRTGMVPQQVMNVEDYCLVESYDDENGIFNILGKHEPSSESILHLYIYREFAKIHTIMHGHSRLLNLHASTLGIPETEQKFPYGTDLLARSALSVLSEETPLIILKDHGFVAMGEDIDTTAEMIIHYYSKMLELL